MNEEKDPLRRKKSKTTIKKRTKRNTTVIRPLIFDNSTRAKSKRAFSKSLTRREVLAILEATLIPKDQQKFEKIMEIPEDSFSSSYNGNKFKRKRIKHKKAKKKIVLPKLRDTSQSAFERFKEEQEKKRKKKEEEERKERIKLKEYFMRLKEIKQLNEEGFDNYINGNIDTLKNIKESNDIKLRKENFIYHIFKDIELDKNRKQKFNFISPLQFLNK